MLSLNDLGWAKHISDWENSAERACQEHRKKTGETRNIKEEYGYITLDCKDLKCSIGCPFLKP